MPDTAFRVEPYFIHRRGVLSIVSARARLRLAELGRMGGSSSLEEAQVDTAFAEAAVETIATAGVQPARIALLHGALKVGQPLWEELAINIRGSGLYARFDHGDLNVRIPFSAPLAEFGTRLEGNFSPEHVVKAASARLHLSGRHRLFLFGYVTAIGSTTATVRLLVIGRRIALDGWGTPYGDRLFVHPERIQEFERMVAIEPSQRDLTPLQVIPEATVKQWFAEIIGQPHVPKDWGGETSDLWTANLHIGSTTGVPVRAAFIFKGPAAFHPMTIADLGINGDQIDRLFREPADVLVLQHCHHVRAEVHNMMDKYAADFRNPRRYSIIDGASTLRIFRAYEKLLWLSTDVFVSKVTEKEPNCWIRLACGSSLTWKTSFGC